MKKYFLWIIELFVWLAIIVSSVFIVHYFNAAKLNTKNTYHIFLKDINGLVKGSPVKIMGVQVGYITQINVIDDYMYVSFIIADKDVSVPQATTAAVESYGIAGSKSIELYPPEEKADGTEPLIFVQEPIRSYEASKNQRAITKLLINVSENTSARLSQKTIKQHQQNIQKLEELSSSVNFKRVDDTTDSLLDKIEKNREKRKKNDK